MPIHKNKVIFEFMKKGLMFLVIGINHSHQKAYNGLHRIPPQIIPPQAKQTRKTQKHTV